METVAGYFLVGILCIWIGRITKGAGQSGKSGN